MPLYLLFRQRVGINVRYTPGFLLPQTPRLGDCHPLAPASRIVRPPGPPSERGWPPPHHAGAIALQTPPGVLLPPWTSAPWGLYQWPSRLVVTTAFSQSVVMLHSTQISFGMMNYTSFLQEFRQYQFRLGVFDDDLIFPGFQMWDSD